MDLLIYVIYNYYIIYIYTIHYTHSFPSFFHASFLVASVVWLDPVAGSLSRRNAWNLRASIVASMPWNKDRDRLENPNVSNEEWWKRFISFRRFSQYMIHLYSSEFRTSMSHIVTSCHIYVRRRGAHLLRCQISGLDIAGWWASTRTLPANHRPENSHRDLLDNLDRYQVHPWNSENKKTKNDCFQ